LAITADHRDRVGVSYPPLGDAGVTGPRLQISLFVSRAGELAHHVAVDDDDADPVDLAVVVHAAYNHDCGACEGLQFARSGCCFATRSRRVLASMSESMRHGAGELERSWRERAFADGNGDAAFG